MKFNLGLNINNISRDHGWDLALDAATQYEYQGNGAWYRFKVNGEWTKTYWLKR